MRHKVVNDGQLMVLLKETLEPQRERGLGFGCMCPCSSFVEIFATKKSSSLASSHMSWSVGVLQELVLVHHFRRCGSHPTLLNSSCVLTTLSMVAFLAS